MLKSEPANWISSMEVIKNTKKLCFCIDTSSAKPLRSTYQEILPDLANLVTVLIAKDRYRHELLWKNNSYLTAWLTQVAKNAVWDPA